jgi:Ca2+-binding RTX toxin-like protein
VALSLLIAGILASPAGAATVGVRDRTDFDPKAGDFNVRTIVVAAGPGEMNRLEVTDAQGVRAHDPAGLTPTAPCVAEDAQTVRCPPNGGLELEVTLGDGDDTLKATIGGRITVTAGDGNDVVDIPGYNSVIDGGAGDDTLTGNELKGGPGADTLSGHFLDFGDRAAGVTLDVAAGPASSAGEVDRFTLASSFRTGDGPDVIRAATAPLYIISGAGDDVIAGGAGDDQVFAGPGNDSIRGAGGNDVLRGDAGEDRIEAGAGFDYVFGGAGNDTLDGGSERDNLYGEAGADTLLARDGASDRVDCAYETRNAEGLQGDRATVDPRDNTSWCEHVTGARGLVLHGLTRTGARSARIVVSCSARRTCTGRVTVRGGRAAQRLRVKPGKRVRLPITRARGEVSVRIVTPTNAVLRATLDAARR